MSAPKPKKRTAARATKKPTTKVGTRRECQDTMLGLVEGVCERCRAPSTPFASLAPVEPAPYVVPEGRALMLRTCAADMSAHGGFVWPRSGEVSAPDWRPVAECGRGLHGLPWGVGDASLTSSAEDAVWIVAEYEVATAIDLTGKIKVPSARVIYAGSRLEAVALVQVHAPAGTPVIYGTATAGYRGTATAGVGGTATAGVGGTATAGVGGAICIQWWDEKRQQHRRLIAEVDGETVRAGVLYRVQDGKLVEVSK